MPIGESANLAQSQSLSEKEFNHLRDFIYAQSGLYFADNKKFLLDNRIQKRLKTINISTISEYLRLVESPARGKNELLELLDAVTTHETSFFRNQPQLDAFRKRALPEVLKTRSDSGIKSLRIWSAACSSGEEPYTLAMLLLETLGGDIAKWRIQIIGTDIGQSVIEKAKEGLFSRYSFRTTPAYFVQKYFDPEGRDGFRIKAEAKKLVEFHLLNFADDVRMRAMRGFHIVFCRNALIYFDAEAKKRFVAHFNNSLDEGGYLFVGHSESLHGISDNFKLILFPGALAYKKPALDEIEDKKHGYGLRKP